MPRNDGPATTETTGPERTAEMSDNEALGGLDWMLDDLTRRMPGVNRAVVLSTDGLLISRSNALSRDDAEHLSAVAAGLQSLARGSGHHFSGGAVQQTVVEMERLFLVVTAAGSGACLAVLAESDADLGRVVYEMNLLVKRVGRYLSTKPRSDLDAKANRGS